MTDFVNLRRMMPFSSGTTTMGGASCGAGSGSDEAATEATGGGGGGGGVVGARGRSRGGLGGVKSTGKKKDYIKPMNKERETECIVVGSGPRHDIAVSVYRGRGSTACCPSCLDSILSKGNRKPGLMLRTYIPRQLPGLPMLPPLSSDSPVSGLPCVSVASPPPATWGRHLPPEVLPLF